MVVFGSSSADQFRLMASLELGMIAWLIDILQGANRYLFLARNASYSSLSSADGNSHSQTFSKTN